MTATRRTVLKTGLAAGAMAAPARPRRTIAALQPVAYRSNVKGFIGMPEIIPFWNVEKT